MGNLSIWGRRNKNSMARPPVIHSIKRGIVLSNHQHLVLMLLPGNANQPIIEKRQIRLTHCTNDQSPVLGRKGDSLFQCVLSPFGNRNFGSTKQAIRRSHSWQHNTQYYHQRQEHQEPCSAENGDRSSPIWRAAGRNWVGVREKMLLMLLLQLLPLMYG